MNHHIPLNALRVFRVAAETGSFKAAASQLFVTQAAISQQIKTLEKHLEQPLFLRLNREVVLTDAGKQLLPYLQQGFDRMEQGLNSLKQDPAPHQLTISTLPSFSARWLVPKLGQFQEIAPDIRVNVSPSINLTAFGDSQTDIAIRFGAGGYDGYYEQLLCHDYLIPLCSPNLLQADQDRLEQLRQLPRLEDNALDMPGFNNRFCEYLGLTPGDKASNLRLQMEDASMLIEAILSGQGYSLLRFSLVYELLERGMLVCPIPCYLELPSSYYLVAPPTHMKRPKVITFQRWISKELSNMSHAWTHFHQTELRGCQPLQPPASSVRD